MSKEKAEKSVSNHWFAAICSGAARGDAILVQVYENPNET
jgi:hypothetical protein